MFLISCLYKGTLIENTSSILSFNSKPNDNKMFSILDFLISDFLIILID